MSDFQVLVFSLTCYKLVTLLIGMIFGVLGYKLFISGIRGKAGELETTWGDKNLTLKQAAPGTFFALFGIILISTTLIKGLDVEKMKSIATSKDNSASPVFLNALSSEEKAVVDKFVNGGNLSENEKQMLQNYLVKQKTLTEHMRGAAITEIK